MKVQLPSTAGAVATAAEEQAANARRQAESDAAAELQRAERWLRALASGSEVSW